MNRKSFLKNLFGVSLVTATTPALSSIPKNKEPQITLKSGNHDICVELEITTSKTAKTKVTKTFKQF